MAEVVEHPVAEVGKDNTDEKKTETETEQDNTNDVEGSKSECDDAEGNAAGGEDDGGDDGDVEDDDDLSLGGSEGSGDEMELDAGAEADDDDDDDDDDDEPRRKRPKQTSEMEVATSGWADAMSKILSSDKAILSKAKKDKDVVMKKTTKIKKESTEMEVVGGEKGKGNEEAEGGETGAEGKKEKKKIDSSVKASHIGRTKPHLFEKQFERYEVLCVWTRFMAKMSDNERYDVADGDRIS